MAHRFFVETPILADTVQLHGDEAHHMGRVMRLTAGDEVVLFDDSGAEFAARIETIDKRLATLAILQRREVDRELPCELTVACALPKGDRQKWLVEKLVELGATRLIPLETARGVAQPHDHAVVRLARGVIEASKQCQRNRLMRIEPACTVAEYLSRAAIGARLVAHPGGPPMPAVLSGTPAAVRLAVGPEGGFTEEELQMATQFGWQLVGLGPRILRVETAAIALTAALALHYGASFHGKA